jgi:hypothetical protein
LDLTLRKARAFAAGFIVSKDGWSRFGTRPSLAAAVNGEEMMRQR